MNELLLASSLFKKYEECLIRSIRSLIESGNIYYDNKSQSYALLRPIDNVTRIVYLDGDIKTDLDIYLNTLRANHFEKLVSLDNENREAYLLLIQKDFESVNPDVVFESLKSSIATSLDKYHYETVTLRNETLRKFEERILKMSFHSFQNSYAELGQFISNNPEKSINNSSNQLELQLKEHLSFLPNYDDKEVMEEVEFKRFIKVLAAFYSKKEYSRANPKFKLDINKGNIRLIFKVLHNNSGFESTKRIKTKVYRTLDEHGQFLVDNIEGHAKVSDLAKQLTKHYLRFERLMKL